MEANENATTGRDPLLGVALAYLATGFVFFLTFGLLGLTMRLTQARLISLSPDWFYRIMTLHGSGMVAAILLAALGGLAAAVRTTLPLHPRWLWTAYILSFLGAGIVPVVTLLGGFAGGWTVLHPLPYHGETWGVWAGAAMYLAYLLIGAGFLVYCLDFLAAGARAYGGLAGALAWRYLARGDADSSAPRPGPAELVGVAVAIVGIFTVAAGTVVLVPLLLEGVGLVGMVDPLFAKNLLYLLGHSLANLTIYLSAALVYVTLPRYTGRKWSLSRPFVLAYNVLILLVLLPFPHHLYQDFAQWPPLALIGEAASYSVALPAFLVTILGGLALMYRSGLRWSVPSILIAIGLWGWTFGGMGALLDSTIEINQVTHNTLWVPAHFHTYYVLGAVAFTWAFLYDLVGRRTGFRETRWSRVAAWLYGLGGVGFVLMFFAGGALSVPRRYAVYLLPTWQLTARLAVPFVLLLVVSIGWLTAEMLLHLLALRRPAPRTFPTPKAGKVSSG